MQKYNKQLEQNYKSTLLKQIIHNSQIIDFRNGKYQGALSKTQLKEGIGVFMDDNLTFIVSKWKQNMPNQQTLIITRTGSYIYGLWDQASQNFSGITVIGTNNYFTLVNFLNNNIKGKTIIVSYEQKSVLVLQKLQILQNNINQKNVQIVEFAKFQENFDLMSIVQIFSNKYSLLIQHYQYSIVEFMKFFVTKPYNQSIILLKNQKKKQLKSKKNEQINQEIVFCLNEKDKNSKRKNEFYFGYGAGIGINFKILQHKFRLLSIGINAEQKVKQFGLKVHDQRCLQQGDFLGKATFTYILQIQRPAEKLLSIYHKIHKRSLNFSNHYFQIKLLYLNIFDNYLTSKGGYIFADCQKQQSKRKYNQMEQQPKKQILQKKQNIFKGKSKTPRKLAQKNSNRNKEIYNKSQKKNQNELLKIIKEKKQDMKNKIEKVKYQIQYKTPEKPTSVFRKKQLMSPISAKLDLSKSKVNKQRNKSKSPINTKKNNKQVNKENNKKFNDVTKKIKVKQQTSPLYHKNKKGEKVFNQLDIQKLLKKRSIDKNVNKYNGRQKKYSDEELDAMIKDYRYRKQRYYHINNIKAENQEEKYQQQRIIQDKIRAELVKMTPEEYFNYHRIQQLQTKQIQNLVLRQNQILQQKILLREIQQKYAEEKRRQCGCKKHPHLQRQVYVYPLEQNLAQKRLRILSDFKKLNKTEINQYSGVDQLKNNYGKTINEYISPNSSRAHYNHAIETTFSNNILNASATKNLQKDYIQQKLIRNQLQRSRKIQRQLLKEEQQNLIRQKMNKHIIQQGININSGKTRYQYYFQ